MPNIFKTKTFWTALATGVTGIIASCGVPEPVLNILPWFFGSLTAIFLRAGVLKNNSNSGPMGPYYNRN